MQENLLCSTLAEFLMAEPDQHGLLLVLKRADAGFPFPDDNLACRIQLVDKQDLINVIP